DDADGADRPQHGEPSHRSGHSALRVCVADLVPAPSYRACLKRLVAARSGIACAALSRRCDEGGPGSRVNGNTVGNDRQTFTTRSRARTMLSRADGPGACSWIEGCALISTDSRFH